jgi:hypothetical protein
MVRSCNETAERSQNKKIYNSSSEMVAHCRYLLTTVQNGNFIQEDIKKLIYGVCPL